MVRLGHMNSTSYMFSFVLGLIVVIVFLVVLNSRFHFVDNLFQADRSARVASVSPTPRPSATPAAQARNNPTVAPTRKPTTAPRQNNTGRILGQTSPTATTPKPTAKPQPTLIAQNNTQNNTQTRNVTQIPNTGFPTIALALIPAGLFAGIRLRKTS